MAALAESADVRQRLGRQLTTDEEELVGGLLDEASDLVDSWMKCVPDPVPDAVRRVVSRMVARSLVARAAGQSIPVGMTQFSQGAGPYQRAGTFSEGSTSGSPWLTRGDKITLRKYGCRGKAMNVGTSDF